MSGASKEEGQAFNVPEIKRERMIEAAVGGTPGDTSVPNTTVAAVLEKCLQGDGAALKLRILSKTKPRQHETKTRQHTPTEPQPRAPAAASTK